MNRDTALKILTVSTAFMPTAENMFNRIYRDQYVPTQARPKSASLRRLLGRP